MIVVTSHGDRRCRERLGLPRRAVQRTVEKAWAEGVRVRAMAGHAVATAATLVLWGRHLFVFDAAGAERRLVTVIADRMFHEERLEVKGAAALAEQRADRAARKRRRHRARRRARDQGVGNRQ